MDIPSIEDIIALVLLWLGLILTGGLLYRELYYRGATKKRYIAKFNMMMGETEIGKAVIHLSSTVKKIETTMEKVDEKIFNRLRGSAGGTAKAAYAEGKELMEQLATVEAVSYPNLEWALDNLDMLASIGLITDGWAANILKLAKNPEALPRLEKAAGTIRKRFGSTEGNKVVKGGNRPW
jgi:hypothetical protein